MIAKSPLKNLIVVCARWFGTETNILLGLKKRSMMINDNNAYKAIHN